MTSPLATAFVQIRAKDGGVAADVAQMANSAVDKAGQQAGTRFAERLRSGMRGQARQAGQAAGEDFGSGFTRDVNGKLRDANGRFITEGRRSGGGFLSGFRSGTGSGGGLAGGIVGSLRGAAGPIAGAVAALGVGQIAKDAVSVEAQFSKTMRTMAAVAGVPAPQIAQLSDLAKKMGADTSFSANEAADAMLELAKGGLSAATIQSGGLAGTLTLAAAAGTDLGTASTIASNALNTFGLAGKDMAEIAAALAGGANASTASVESLGEALSQVGPGAKNAGLDLHDTVGVLAAFDQAGLKGSDAGTSLKTMLVSLVPQTDKASSAMRKLGLDFTDAKGNFLPIGDVAEQLQKKLGGLSEEAKTVALSEIFGSDASRAASVLTNLGKKGLAPFITATRDAGAAQKAAQAAMGGTSGALERLQGSVETAKLRLGEFLAPAVIAGANALTEGLERVGPAIGAIQAAGTLLFTGDFNGGIRKALGVEEDSNLVGGLLAVRQGVLGVGGALQLIVTGDFNGGIRKALGVEEDSDLVARLLSIRQAIGGVLAFIQLMVTGNYNGILSRAFGIEEDSQIVGDLLAIRDTVKQFVGEVRLEFGQVMGAVRAGLGPVAPYARQALGSLKQIVGDVIGIIAVLMRQGLSTMQTLWRIFGPTILAYIGPAMRAIATMIAGVLQVIAGITKTVLALLRGDWSGAASGIRQIVSGLAQFVLGAWRLAMAGQRAMVSAGIAVLRALFGDMVSSVRSRISDAVSEVRGFGSRVRSAIGGLGSILVSAGRNLIDGLISGIEDRVGALRAKVSGIAGQIRDYFPFSPAKRGPLRTHPMHVAGRNIVSSLADGLAQTSRLDSAVAGIAGRIGSGVGAPDLGGAGSSGGAGRLHPDDIKDLAVAIGQAITQALARLLPKEVVLDSNALTGAVERHLGTMYG